MILETTQKAIVEALKALKKIIIDASCFLYYDDQIIESPIRLMYNDSSESESFENEIEALTKALLKSFGEYKILKPEDAINMLRWLINQLSEPRNPCNFEGNRISNITDTEKVIEVYNRLFPEFELIRLNAQQHILNSLNEELTIIEEKFAANGLIKRKIKWNGTLIEFSELLLQLEDKGWIEFPEIDKQDSIKGLCKVFDVSKAQKQPNEVTAAETICRNLRVNMRDRDGELKPYYDKIYTSTYVPKFKMLEEKI